MPGLIVSILLKSLLRPDSKEGGKLDELVSEILDELVIYVGNPGLEFDGDVFEQKMDAVLLLQH